MKVGGFAWEVCDDGIGFSPELGARLFEPFEQGAAATDQRFPGLGLGPGHRTRDCGSAWGEYSREERWPRARRHVHGRFTGRGTAGH